MFENQCTKAEKNTCHEDLHVDNGTDCKKSGDNTSEQHVQSMRAICNLIFEQRAYFPTCILWAQANNGAEWKEQHNDNNSKHSS